MNHQALKYAPSLINDGQFTQGLSHWFGSFVSHEKSTAGNFFQAVCDRVPAGRYRVGVPYGISQYIDSPEVHSFPATRRASEIQLLPLGTDLALLITTGDTKLEGEALTPGVPQADSPYDRFQHPFRWQDDVGAVNIEPSTSISINGYEGYSGEYSAGLLLVESAPTDQEIVHHRLYVSPRAPIPAVASRATLSSIRVTCLPSTGLSTGTLTFSGTPDDVQLLRGTMNEAGVASLVVVLNNEFQVTLTSSGSLGVGATEFDAQYSVIVPGGNSPQAQQFFSEWAVFRRASITCKYTMPLYGYRYTLAYTYSGARPQPAEVTFRQAVQGPDGFTLSGFGEIAFRVYSDSSRSEFPSTISNYPRNIELLRGEARSKVSGRPMLTIPIVRTAVTLDGGRTLSRIRRIGNSYAVELSAPGEEIDSDARPLVNMRWVNGTGALGGTNGRLYMGGIVEPSSVPYQTGDSLGSVVFTGHLSGIVPDLTSFENVTGFMAHLLYGQPEEVTAELFFNDVVGQEELYVEFTVGGRVLVSSLDIPGAEDAEVTENEVYSLTGNDTLGIRGSYWGTDVDDPEYSRIRPGSSIGFVNAPEVTGFLNSNIYEVGSVYYVASGSNGNTISYLLLNQVSFDDFAVGSDVTISPQLGTMFGIPGSEGSEGATLTKITDASLWSGDLTSSLPDNDASTLSSRDLLTRHTDPIASMFPKGTVMLYAGGGACPAGFKPVQAVAESRSPGVFGDPLSVPASTSYDAVRDVTTIKFRPGSLPDLLDSTGARIQLTTPVTVPVAAPSLELSAEIDPVLGTKRRLPAISSLGDEIFLSQVSRIFRSAIEVGMTLRVQESTAPDSAPLTNEDRGFLVVDDVPEEVDDDSYTASARRSPRPANGGDGYRFGQNDQDVGITQNPQSSRYEPNSPEYHWGTGYGRVTYPSSDPGIQQPYDQTSGGRGYLNKDDQALLTPADVSSSLKTAFGGANRLAVQENDRLFPKYPTRYTQTPHLNPIGPNIWGQRERFFFDTPDSELPRTDFARAPLLNPGGAPSVLMTTRGFYNGLQIETGRSGGESRVGMPRGGTYGYLPNPAWDLSNLENVDLTKFPPQAINFVCDLLPGGSAGEEYGQIAMWEGMVFYCRVYARCEGWDSVNQRPSGNITGWFSSITQSSANVANPNGIGFLHSTFLVTTYAVGNAPALGYEQNVNLYPYTFPLGGENFARGAVPHPTYGGNNWLSGLPSYAILQLTPAVLYGPPNQPQTWGPTSFTELGGTAGARTIIGRSSGVTAPQTSFTYDRPAASPEPVTAWATLGSTTTSSTIKVLGDATGLDRGDHNIYVEPSGYLKYGDVGAYLDHGPGKHSHIIERNPNLLGPQNLAQPKDAEGRYFLSLPSVHGHDTAGEPRSLLPAANLFTSCIKL